MRKRLITTLAAATIGAAALVLSSPGAAFANTASVSPGTVAPGGSISVHVSCTGAGSETVEALWGLAGGQAQPNHTTSLTLNNGEGTAHFTIPAGTHAGSYSAGAFCPGASEATMAHFTVSPTGAPRGGTGLDDTTDAALAVAGLGTLAAAGVAGGFLLMRRRSDAPVA